MFHNGVIIMSSPSRKLVNRPVEHRWLISKQHNDYVRIENWIRQSLPNVRLTKIEMVDNSFLTTSYNLKKAEYVAKKKYVQEQEFLHSTTEKNVDSICKDNFNWRLVSRAKFGRGTSFSTNADYANCHSSKENGFCRAFIVTKVMMADVEEGYKRLIVPTGNNDTTTNHNDLVYVKYQDHEFLPLFVAYYECPDSMITGSPYYRNWR